MSNSSSVNPIVIDSGSSSIKAGFAGSETPQLIVPSVVAYHRTNTSSATGTGTGSDHPNDADAPSLYVGRDAIRKAERAWDVVQLRYAVSGGHIMDWDHMEELWDLTLDTLLNNNSNSNSNSQYTDADLILPVHPLLPQHHRTTIAEIMFETFHVRSLSLLSSGVASVWSSADSRHASGISIESGDGATTITPVVHLSPAPCPPRRFPVSGNALSTFMRSLLPQHTAAALADYRGSKVIRHIKHNMCYTSLDLDADLRAQRQHPEDFRQVLALPGDDGGEVVLGREAFLVPEVMFAPSIAGLTDAGGLAAAVIDTLAGLDTSLRGPLLANIVLGGGNTLFDGMAERLQTEVRQRYGGSGSRVKVRVQSGRLYRVYEGASVYGVSAEYAKHRVMQEDWTERGDALIGGTTNRWLV